MSNSEVWPLIAVALRGLAGGEGVVEAQQHLGRVAEAVERTDLDQRLQHLAVGEAQVHPGAEVGERPELAALLAGLDDRLDRALADVLDRQQAEADGLALDREAQAGPVHVRGPDLDPQPAALRDGGGHLLRVVPERGEHGRHVLDRVVRLEVRGLVGDQAVAGGVGLVEPVALERLEGLEHRVDRLRRDATLGGALDERLLHRPQDRRLLLADRVAQRVRLGPREAAQGHGRGHDVLLVDEDAVRPVQERLEQRVEVDDRLLAVLAPDVGRDVVHRPRAVERHHGREVVHRGRLQLADVAAHARRLELEHAGRLARREQLEGLRVVERDVVEVDRDAAVLRDQVHGLAQDREVGQAQEVELEQAQRLDAVHLVLGHERVRVGRLLERHQLRQRLAADDDAGRVGGRVAGDPLELLGELDQLGDLRVAVVHLLELRRL